MSTSSLFLILMPTSLKTLQFIEALSLKCDVCSRFKGKLWFSPFPNALIQGINIAAGEAGSGCISAWFLPRQTRARHFAQQGLGSKAELYPPHWDVTAKLPYQSVPTRQVYTCRCCQKYSLIQLLQW